MNTAKAHIHIAIRCELTAVFLYTIFFWAILEESRKLSLYLLYSEVQKYCNLCKTQNKFCFFHKNAALSMAYVKDKWYLSRILYTYGLKPLYVFGRFICILCNKCGGVLWTLSFLVMMKRVKLFCHRNTSLDSKSVLLSITGTSTLVL